MARAYSQDLRDRVIDAVLLEGVSRRSAAIQFGVSCLIPRFDGVILSLEWKEAIADNVNVAVVGILVRDEIRMVFTRKKFEIVLNEIAFVDEIFLNNLL